MGTVVPVAHNHQKEIAMPLIDATAVQKEAKDELAKERMKQAKEKLKELYVKEEKAGLVLKNIRKEIDNYINEMAELTTYEAAGVDVPGQ
jgi:phosphopantetheine adenylyltransferase